jgi:DNA modification methylase
MSANTLGRNRPVETGATAPRRSLSITYKAITDLNPDPKNPRIHTTKQVRQIARSIEVFGFNVPVLIDARGQLIAGHGRLLAAQLLGMTEVPTISLEHLSEAQIRAYMITDNRLTENSIWDDRLLAEQFKALAELDINFSVEITGFETSQIDLIIENAAPTEQGTVDLADKVPDFSSKPQVARAGDCWLLDRHRVYCGDARNDTAFRALMLDRRAQIAFTDPPFNIRIDGNVSGFGKIHHPEFAVASGEMSPAEFSEFLRSICEQLARNSTDGALQFICMDWRHTEELLSAARSVYSGLQNVCVWVKECGGQGSLYRSQHEFIFVFKNGKKAHKNNIQLGQYGRYRTNVWSYPRVNFLSRRTDEGNLSTLHPTIKPVELVADAILDCSSRGDLVLDPFLGSGTSVIAAERTGRVCFGMELEPHYIDTVVRRWQAFTGQSAILEATGQTFNEIEGGCDGRTR